MLGMLGTFPVLSPVDGGGWDLGSRVDITSREGVRIGGTWDRGSRLDITFSPYTRSNLSTDFASVATRSIQRCIRGQRTPAFSISTSLARNSLIRVFATNSSIVPSRKSYQSCSYLRYRPSKSNDIARNSFSLLRKGKCGNAIRRTWPTPIIKAHMFLCCCHRVQAPTLDADVSASKNDKARLESPGILEHSQVYKALNLILAKLFQIRASEVET